MEKNSFGMMRAPEAAVIQDLLTGSIDIHVHIAPDPSICRGYDAVDAALEARAWGVGGYVAKSFFAPTTADSLLACKAVPEVRTFGSVTIGYVTTGGLDYAAPVLKTHAQMGCRVIWFPAFDAENCKRALGQEGGISILDGKGALKPQIHEILEVAKAYQMVVCSGHMSYGETIALFQAARSMGIDKLVATHPLVEIWPAFTEEQLRACLDQGAKIELTYCQVMPRLGSFDPRKYIRCVKTFGAENCIISTDGSQITDPSPALCMRLHIAMMLQFGCTEAEVRRMCQENPRHLLDIA